MIIVNATEIARGSRNDFFPGYAIKLNYDGRCVYGWYPRSPCQTHSGLRCHASLKCFAGANTEAEHRVNPLQLRVSHTCQSRQTKVRVHDVCQRYLRQYLGAFGYGLLLMGQIE